MGARLRWHERSLTYWYKVASVNGLPRMPEPRHQRRNWLIDDTLLLRVPSDLSPSVSATIYATASSLAPSFWQRARLRPNVQSAPSVKAITIHLRSASRLGSGPAAGGSCASSTASAGSAPMVSLPRPCAPAQTSVLTVEPSKIDGSGSYGM